MSVEYDPTVIDFSAEVASQSTSDSPASIEATLTNTASEAVEVIFGPTLLYTPESDSSRFEWSNQLILDPRTSIGPWATPVETDDGCHRFPRNGDRYVRSEVWGRTLDSGESVPEVYDVYTHGSDLPCLPAGSHRYQDEIYVGDRSNPGIITLGLRVAENGTITIAESSVEDA
ncbi:hypothetical protein [Halomicrobium katesii]|uniref:hypothetical protein n=1 Tax=Halomicrobium katesii TaxID=437163 RepID=UPI0012BACA8B|nr:hypothetical protein [Halomicrobium katesii]